MYIYIIYIYTYVYINMYIYIHIYIGYVYIYMGTCLTSFAVIWSTCKLIHPAHPAPAIIWSLEMSAGNA